MRLVCKSCGFSKNFQTSKRTAKSYNVNLQSVYASQAVGRSGLSTFCGIMNLPKPLSKQSYNLIQKKLTEKAKTIADYLPRVDFLMMCFLRFTLQMCFFSFAKALGKFFEQEFHKNSYVFIVRFYMRCITML